MTDLRLKKIVILGGGTAGWMTAASLSQHLKSLACDITVIDSSAISSVGVGEATIPSIRRFYAELDMNDIEVMKATQATCKLGIEFVGWHKENTRFFHPFGLFGQDIKHVGFQHFWSKMRKKGKAKEIEAYSLCTMLAKNSRFSTPAPRPQSPLSVFDWALHLDANLFAQLMKGYAINNGVKHIDGKLISVTTRAHDGFIESLQLENNVTIEGDLFIDCSGLNALLIEKTLKSGFEDWSHWLPCDSAVALQSTKMESPPPYTVSTAQDNGWQWNIPLQNRVGNGSVYCSHYLSDDHAWENLVKNISGEIISEPKLIKFKTGMRKRAWVKNCIAIGLSAGFLEPLESTGIAFVENAIQRLKMLFPDKSFDPSLILEFNEMTRLEFESSRDFLVLHYKLSQRGGSEFWRYCQSMNIPERLQHKLNVYGARGHLVKYRWEIFQNPSWIAIYTGNNIIPKSYNLFVDNFSDDYLEQAFQEMAKSIEDGVADTMLHQQFLQKYLV